MHLQNDTIGFSHSYYVISTKPNLLTNVINIDGLSILMFVFPLVLLEPLDDKQEENIYFVDFYFNSLQ